ncbi:unnamed protein product [Parnassius apollo]|uniref:(apollo) hypothetical protein n=1 Tax=Parnassius apollo TaxID=110799 RepID=A0A8S3XXN8_PARAO|nr:unnamed protein product [Parnassius apollo]
MLKNVIFLTAVLSLLNKTMCFYILKPTEAIYTRSSALIFNFQTPLSDQSQAKHEMKLSGYMNEKNNIRKNEMKNTEVNPNNTYEDNGHQSYSDLFNKNVTCDISNDSDINSKKVPKTEIKTNLDLINTENKQEYKTTDKSDTETTTYIEDFTTYDFFNENSTATPVYNEEIPDGDLSNRADVPALVLASMVG